MSEGNLIPDSPFRSGITGKYKLLIKDVTPKFGSYEYELMDGDGREYKATAKEHNAKGELLRCMVSFQVVNARLVVSDVAVCKKQDLATLIPEPPKSEPKTKAKKKKPEPEVEDPIHGRVSGVYNLRVVEVNRQGKKCLYVLEDAKGRKYNAQSSTYYAEGKIIGCQVNTLITGRGYKATVTKVGGSRYHKKRQERDGLQTQDWMEGPNPGDLFHLIYTPMGNKR